MKKEWKVYIKSVPGRGNEVIKMLEDLGAKNSFDYEGNMLEALYYIWHDGSIHVESTDNEYGQIIMENYHELHLPEQWKDGDVLINKDKTDYKVFLKYDSDSDTTFYAYNVSICVNGIITKCLGSIWHGDMLLCYREDYYLATSKEIEQFHNILHKAHKEWDAEKKQLVDWKWKPNERDYYYYISSLGKVIGTTYLDTDSDKSSFDFGNCFCTEEEANTMAEKIKKLLKGKS